MRNEELEALRGSAKSIRPASSIRCRDRDLGQNQPQGSSQGSSHGSVPNVRAPEIAGGGRPAWNTGQVLQQNQAPGPFNQPGYAQPYGGAQQQPSAFGGGGG